MNTAAAIGPEMAETGDFSFAELGRIAAGASTASVDPAPFLTTDSQL